MLPPRPQRCARLRNLTPLHREAVHRRDRAILDRIFKFFRSHRLETPLPQPAPDRRTEQAALKALPAARLASTIKLLGYHHCHDRLSAATRLLAILLAVVFGLCARLPVPSLCQHLLRRPVQSLRRRPRSNSRLPPHLGARRADSDRRVHCLHRASGIGTLVHSPHRYATLPPSSIPAFATPRFAAHASAHLIPRLSHTRLRSRSP